MGIIIIIIAVIPILGMFVGLVIGNIIIKSKKHSISSEPTMVDRIIGRIVSLGIFVLVCFYMFRESLAHAIKEQEISIGYSIVFTLCGICIPIVSHIITSIYRERIHAKK